MKKTYHIRAFTKDRDGMAWTAHGIPTLDFPPKRDPVTGAIRIAEGLPRCKARRLAVQRVKDIITAGMWKEGTIKYLVEEDG